MSETHQDNGQHEAIEAPTMDLKAQIAEQARQLRAGYVAEIDQLEAQRAELHERVKLLKAEVENIDKINANATKVVKARGRTQSAAPRQIGRR